MYNYIKGIITDIQKDHIVLENNGIGYQIFTSNPYEFEENKNGDSNITVYVHQHVKEDAIQLFGFKSKETKEIFLKLITVKGVGCKTACTMLAKGDPTDICNAINNDDVNYLKKIPGIGPKAAQQIVLDLKGKLESISQQELEKASKNIENLNDAIEVLKALGYKTTEIKKIKSKIIIAENTTTNEYVKQGLSLLSKS